MKKRTEVKNMLGLTQNEMAMALGITRSQWTMCKSGQRDLPLDALQQFSVLLQGVQKEKTSKTVQHFIKEEQHKTNEKLKEAYENTQIKLSRVQKEINTIEKQRTESFAALKTAEFLENHDDKFGLASSIRARAIKSLHKYSLYKLEKLQLQKENFELLKNKLIKRIHQADNEK
ncbi:MULTISPECIES: hypothetical protein [Flavobacterium]|uniref:HTH cro/C1-type domain-containing protein n=1 Tax=Flavobacterium hankyongi TaxID=1176532 RepID=A0ABP9A033_9FLAO|nr:hypothetical protein [Flavobacterium sp. N1846]